MVLDRTEVIERVVMTIIGRVAMADFHLVHGVAQIAWRIRLLLRQRLLPSRMNPDVAYFILAVCAVLVLFFLYRTYQEYKKSPGRWALRELASAWMERLT